MLRRTAASLFLCTVLLTPVLAVSTTVGAQPEPSSEAALNDAIRGFLNENAPGYLPEGVSGGGANTSGALTSFGGDSQHDAEKADGIIIEDTFTAVINPTGTRGFGQFGDGLTGPTIRLGDASTPGADSDGAVFLDDLFGGPIADGSGVPPTGPAALPSLDDILANIGADLMEFRAMGNESPILIDGPVIVHGVRVRGTLPLTPDCGGDIIEIGSSFHLSGGNEWPLNPTFADDPFIGGSDAVLGRCRPGTGWYLDSLRNNGSSFLPVTGDPGSVGLVGPKGAVIFTNASALPGAWGVRNFAFTTPGVGGYTPTNTAHTVNVFPDFRTADTWPTLVGDPFPGYPRVGAFPLTLDFTGSNDTSLCGPNQWSDRYELHVEDSSPPYTAKLYQLASGQFTAGSLSLTEDEITWMTEGGGSGYAEGFTFKGAMGDYEYRPEGSVCPMQVTVSRGWDAVSSYDWLDPTITAVTPPYDPITGQLIEPADSGLGSPDLGAITLDPVGPGSGSSNATEYALLGGGIVLIGGGYAYERRRKCVHNLATEDLVR